MVNTLTLNPAIDKVLYLNNLKKNSTNRIQSIADTIGGKGTHVSVGLKILGQPSRSFGIAYGAAGTKIIQMLRQSEIDVRFLHRDGCESRTNYLLVEGNNDSTLITEKGVELPREDIDALLVKLRNEVEASDDLVIAGDASNCSDPMIYNVILRSLQEKKLRVFLDTSGETLVRCLEESPFLIKPNLDELSALCNRVISCRDDDVIAAIDSLQPYHIAVIAVSLGREGSLVKYRGQYYRTFAPAVCVVNTIGCGDSFMSGLVYGFSAGLPIAQTLRIATSVSAAAAECPLSVGFDAGRAKELAESVRVQLIR